MERQENSQAFFIEQRDADLAGSAAAIRYDLHFDRAAQHLIGVAMEIDGPGAQLDLCMPAWTPGSYKIREYSANQGNLHITDGNGNPLSWAWVSKNRLRVESGDSATVRAEYLSYAHERTVRTSHVNRFHAFIMPGTCLMYAEGRTDEVHHVRLHHDRDQWPQVSTPLSPVNSAGTGPLLLAASNYDCLVDSPLEMGDHYVASFESHGAVTEVAIAGTGNFDRDWIVERLKHIVDVEAELMNGLPYDRYVFILQMYPDTFGGLEHTRCSVNAFDTNLADDKKQILRFLELLCHEYFHLWNVKRIRPLELGPFDYLNETYTDMLWLAEGVTSYYDDLLTFRCGFRTESEFMSTFADQHLWREAKGPGRLQMNVLDSSYLAWVKLYFSNGDSHNRFPSYYTRGGAIFFLLDLFIVAQSEGRKTLDEGLRALWRAYLERPERGITAPEFMTIVGEATGVEIGPQLTEWLSSTKDLPYAEALEPFGLRWRAKEADERPDFAEGIEAMPKPAKTFTGMAVQDKSGKTMVVSVTDDTPAAAAGFGIDDEIIAVNGRRVKSAADFEHAINANGVDTDALVSAECDGQIYEAVLRPIVRPDWTIEIVEETNDAQKKLRDAYFNRGMD